MVIDYIIKNIDVKRIIHNHRISNEDEMYSTVMLILLEKPEEWLIIRYYNKCLERSISTIIKNQKNDQNSLYHKGVCKNDCYLNEETEYKLSEEEENDILYNKSLDIIGDIFSEDESLLEMYKNYVLNDKTLAQIAIEYNVSVQTISKRFRQVEKYVKYNFEKRLKL